MSKSKRDLIEAQNRAQRAKDFKINPETVIGIDDVLGERELAELKNMKITLGDDLKKYNQVQRQSNANSMADGEYEVQYDPNNDFAIFGMGDPTTGGI